MDNNNFFERDTNAPADQGPDAEAQRSRRRNLLLGGGAGAILATVKSGSALAGGVCVSPSAFSSIRANSTTSHRPTTFAQCSSHGFYGNSGGGINLDARWNPVPRLTATLRSQGFPSGGRWNLDTKLFDIVKTGPSSLWQEEGNLIVIYLDVMTFNRPEARTLLSVSDVMSLWRILFGLGGHDPKFDGWDAFKVRQFYDVWVSGGL